MKYEVLQTSTYDCGFTVLKVLLANLNKDRNYLLMPELKGKKYSLLDLKEIAKAHQLELEGYKIDDLNVLDNFSFPLICQIKKGKSEHFILLNKVKGNKYFIFDPSVGEIVLSYEEFSDVFNNNVMSIKEHSKTKYPIEKGTIDSNLLCSLVFNFLAASSFFTTLIFMDDYLLFLISMVMGFIFLFIQKIANQKFVLATNKTYNLSYDNLLSVSNYQKHVISKLSNLPSKIILLFALVIMMNNSYQLGYLNVLFILICMALYYYFIAELKKEANKLEYFEQCRIDLNIVNKLANKYSNKIVVILVLFSIFIATFVFYMMQMNDLVGIDFFVLQFSLMFATLIFSKDLLSLDDIFKETLRRKLIISKNKTQK